MASKCAHTEKCSCRVIEKNIVSVVVVGKCRMECQTILTRTKKSS